MVYDVLATPDLEELCGWVNRKLKQGWSLQGGIATMTNEPGYTVFYQAIIKEKLNFSEITSKQEEHNGQ